MSKKTEFVDFLASINQLKEKLESKISAQEMDEVLKQMMLLHGEALHEQYLLANNPHSDELHLKMSTNESLLYLMSERVRESIQIVRKEKKKISKTKTESPAQTKPISSGKVVANIIKSETGDKIQLSIPPTEQQSIKSDNMSVFATETKMKGGDQAATESTTEILNKLNSEQISELMKEYEEKKNNKNSLSTSKTTIVNYYANWCGPSKKFYPHWVEFKKMAELKYPNLQVLELDVGTDKELSDLAEKVGVTGYPTVILFHKGQVIKRNAGDAATLCKFIDEQMK